MNRYVIKNNGHKLEDYYKGRREIYILKHWMEIEAQVLVPVNENKI